MKLSNSNLLPMTWAESSLDKISKIILGQSPPSSTYNNSGKGLPFFQGKAEFGDLYPTVKKWCIEPKKIAGEGDVLISVRAPVGPTNINPSKSCIGRGLAAISPLNDISNKYILYLMRAFESVLSGQGTGTTFNAITGNQLKSFAVPIAPLNEQKRIVAKIEQLFSDLDAGVETLQALKKQIRQYRQSVLKYAFEGKLTAEWRKKNKPEPASKLLEKIAKEKEQKSKGKKQKKLPKLDTTDLPELPNGWEYVRLPQIGELNRGKSKHRPRNAPFLYGGPYPFIQTGDIRHANGIVKEYKQTYSEEGLKQSKLWKAGTLCITIAANIADTAILGFDACIPDSVVGYEADSTQSNIHYIEYFFRWAKKDIERYAPATAQKNINLAILSDLAVPYPSIEEQKYIVSEIERNYSIVDKAEEVVDAAIKQSKRLRQSILKRAFEGKLVAQDPTDEPAEKLLERIGKEKN